MAKQVREETVLAEVPKGYYMVRIDVPRNVVEACKIGYKYEDGVCISPTGEIESPILVQSTLRTVRR